MMLLPFAIPFLACLSLVSGLKECKKIDACKASTDEGVIDLWSLQASGSQPKYGKYPS